MNNNSHPPIEATPLRRNAETKLREREDTVSEATTATKSVADSQRLLHELQVHQIELEMQNEELQKARGEIEAELGKYSELYDFAPVGYLTLDHQGVIHEANLTAASLLGIPRAPLVKQRLGLFVTAADRAVFDAFLQHVFTNTERQECDVQLFGKNKTPEEVRLRANLAESGKICRVALTVITEHKQDEAKIRVSETRYRRLFETAHDGVLLIDPGTRKITDANPFMTKLLGYPRDQLVGKELFEIGLLKDEGASQEMFRKLKRNHEVRYEDLPLESQGGRHQEVEVVANLYEENGRPVIQCNIRDITERKHAETALRESEERYRTLFTSIDEGFCVVEMIYDRRRKPVDYRYLEVNPAFAKQTGLVKPIGKTMRELLPGIEDHWIEFYDNVVLTGKAVRFVNEAKAMGGHWFDVYACPVGGPGSPKVAIIFNDITARRKSDDSLRAARVQLTQHAKMLEKTVAARTVELTATNRRLNGAVLNAGKSKEQYHQLFLESQIMQKKLRQLTHQIITAQEEERKEISRELHDVVVQTLVGINVELSALGHAAAAHAPALKDKIARTQRLVESSVDSVHRFARDLRPAVLDDLGLIPALHAYCKNLAARQKFKIQLTAFAGIESLAAAKRIVLFRVAQEALTNVVRHANATKVVLSITRIAESIRMEIGDNGKSFSVRKTLQTRTNKRLGLVGMRERLTMIGGSLTIESKAGQGTTVRAEIPFTLEKTKK